MVGEEKRNEMMQNLFGDQSEEEEEDDEEEEVESEHESNRQPDYASDEGDIGMKPEGDDVVEGHGEAEVGSDSDGELQEVDQDQEHIESEGERDQSSQEVDLGDQRDERDESEGKDSGSDQIGQRVVTSRRREVVESDSERSEENQYMDNADEEIDQARSQRSPEEEKDEAHISETAPEIRDVFGESDDEEPAEYDAAQTNLEDDSNRSPMEDEGYEKDLRPEDMLADEEGRYDSEEDNIIKAKEKPMIPPLERPVPIEGQPVDLELRKSWGWWKVKRWTVHILNRLYTRFGDTKLQNPKNRAFAQNFITNYAGKILECHINLLDVIRVGGYLPDRVTNLILQYLSTSISKTAMYNLLQPRLDVVLFEIIFPLMCFNENDQKLWEEDPHEYIRKGYDIIEDLYSPRTAAMDFVSELVRRRGKESLQKFILFIVEIFKRYEEAPSELKPYRQKDGALLAIGALCDKLRQTEPYKSDLERMLVQHVFPEFSSPSGHLRAKAAWVAGQYAQINFSDTNNFRKALQSVIAGIRDPELPVRVDSVFALRAFVEACKDLSEIRQILPQLLDEYFKLMNEVENEDLVFTLETIVERFGEEMAPYAIGLCQRLGDAFWKCMNTGAADDEPDTMSAVGCLRVISTILKSVSKLPHLFSHIEPTVLPIMRRMLTIEGQEVFEEVLEIASYMTFLSPSISMEMWSLWPLLMQALADWAIGFFPNILVPMDNYISRSTVHYLTCKEPDYQQSLWNILSNIMNDRNLDDNDVEPAPKLIEVVFLNCKGQVDHWVEPYVRLTVERLRRAERPFLKCLLIQVIADAFYYNAFLTLNILKKIGVASEIFDIWFQMLQQTKKSGIRVHFKREHDKKVCCLGLTSLLPLSADQLPEEVLDRVFKANQLLVAYKDQVAEAEKEEPKDDDDMDNDDNSDDDDGDMGDDAEDSEEGDSLRLQKLAAQDNAFHSVDDYSEDDELQSPIDEVDPFVFFVNTIKVLQASDQTRFQNLTVGLDSHYKTLASAVAQHAEQRRRDAEKEKVTVAAAAF